MRIGNGPRLAVPRPGTRRPYGRWGWDRTNRGQAYDEHRARERKRLRFSTAPAGDRKRPTTVASSVPIGKSYRLVDGHGRSYGPRFTSPGFMEHQRAPVRRVNRQPETLHSQLSRMLKRAHKLAMRDE